MLSWSWHNLPFNCLQAESSASSTNSSYTLVGQRVVSGPSTMSKKAVSGCCAPQRSAAQYLVWLYWKLHLTTITPRPPERIILRTLEFWLQRNASFSIPNHSSLLKQTSIAREWPLLPPLASSYPLSIPALSSRIKYGAQSRYRNLHSGPGYLHPTLC